jgi:ABC-type lipoprotein export system ATPase subunit
LASVGQKQRVAIARELGVALLVVTHDPKVRSICDRVLRIEDGTVVGKA